MATGICAQMNCCLCCGGPILPSGAAMRHDRIGSRALFYMEGEAIRNRSDWNLGGNAEPNLLAQKESLHLFPETNVIPAMKTYYNGANSDTWANTNSAGYHAGFFVHGLVNPRANARHNLLVRVDRNYVIGTEAKRKTRVAGGAGALPYPIPTQENLMAVVCWERPDHIDGFDMLNNLLDACVLRTGNQAVLVPDPDQVIPGCKSCNDIMTQRATSAFYLARVYPLVPDEAIFRQNIYTTNNRFRYGGHYRWDPTDATRDRQNGFFSYEACVAYFIHMCLPVRAAGAVNNPLRIRRQIVRKLVVCLSVAIHFTACLIFERYNGLRGGTEPRTKHAYRYRGVVEMYLAYIFWTLVRNDNPHGVPDGFNQQRCEMDFPRFHRYLFTEIVDMLVLSNPQFANAYEFSDILLGPYVRRDPEPTVAHMCQCIVDFYTNHLKPMLSRHFAGLDPDRQLENGPAADVALFSRQVLAYNMLVSPENLNTIMHFLERATEGDIDTFINCAGIHSVLNCWNRLLQMCPTKTGKLIDDFTDALVLKEYSHIMKFMAGPVQPKITPQVAETVYIMCNTLNAPSEPNNEEELALLRITPKCSPHNAVIRLNMVGAFSDENVE